MNKKLLVLGLVCLLSQSMRAMEDSPASEEGPKSEAAVSSDANTTSKASSSDASSEEVSCTDTTGRSCCFTRVTSWMSGWSTCTKITAGLALVGTTVGLMYKYGCRCCEDTKKRVVRADA